ncbi:MAG: N-acetylmuramoyl-L-alanine amidase [Akkermansia sp.]|nr:N-acetylmuramoyl-L-alanine amidase [Akkermansia sp.]
MMKARTVLSVITALLLGLAGMLWGAERFTHATVNGQDYVKLADVWNFYGFRPVQGRAGCVNYGAGNRVISVRPGKQDFYVNNYRYILSFPVQTVDGTLMISATDMEKLVDPVLRPRYSENAGTIRTVVLDAGHGGHDNGAVSAYAVEKECNLAVAHKVRALLQKKGYRVVMTRDKDFFLTLQQRVEIANNVPDSIFVSIHHNSSGSHATGIETFTLAPHGTTSPFARTRRMEDLSGNNQDSENIALATAIHSRAIRNTGAIDRGIQRARFSVLCTIRRPAILFEGGFVSNPEEGVKITTEEYRDTLAKSIVDGILAYSRTVCSNRPKSTQVVGTNKLGGGSVGSRDSKGNPKSGRGPHVQTSISGERARQLQSTRKTRRR